MKKTLTLLAAALLVSSSVFAADKPKTDFKKLLQAKAKNVPDALADLRRLPIAAPCKAKFDAAVKAAEDEQKACNNLANPPAGSPAADFLAKNDLQQGQFCNGLGLSDDACVDKVLKDQAIFCARGAARAELTAKAVKNACEAAQKACTDAKAAVTKNAADTAAAEKVVADLKAASAGLKTTSDTACQKAADAAK